MSDTFDRGVGNDPLAHQLARLAPTVDMVESRAVFENGCGGTTRGGGDGPRWWLAAAVLVLVVGGIVGLWALTRDDTTAPATPVDEPAEEPEADDKVTEGIVEPGDGFEVLLVAETNLAFGQAWVATDQETYDEIGNPDPGGLEPDFATSIALLTVQPDNACPDTLVRFEVAPGADGVPVWTPMFEEQAEACEDPLLSWMYVVTIDRVALGDEAVLRIPADDVFDVDEQLLRYVAGAAEQAPAVEDPDVVIEPTGITVPVPALDEPTIHNTGAGLVWAVTHDDGSVSVLPATIDVPTDEDEGGVTNLTTLVVASDSGDTFAGGRFQWDAWGRAINGGRANDLVGYGGQVDGDELEILRSTATRVPGDVESSDTDSTESYDRPDLGRPIDIPTFYTLSSSGPIWRYLDAALVVENGVGRICEIDTAVPIDQLTTCDDAEFVLETAVTSIRPEITTWYPGPILAFQDPIRQFTKVIPLAGSMSLNTAAFDEPTDTITGG